ncbi:S-layer homology domain-containing protein [Paenibacillus tengchongensis]|uniref:S-layer homology domain-containing protein n=1 Tax=Paenibacillus tengchongensis TaxID=2608684 RepID=UPI00124CA5FD|nr:S-layer homology domain-containing protein [Paenibacillus tengchongensis]
MANQKWRRIFIAATAVTVMTMGAQSFAAGADFTDLEGNAAKAHIVELQQKGILHGVGGGAFMPDAPLTAAQAVELLVNGLDLNLDTVRFVKEPLATDYFSQADNGGWYAQALITAAVNGVDLPRDLNPGEEWTREEFTHRLILAIEQHSNLPVIKLAPVDIADGGEITSGYDGSIQRALALGIAGLDTGGQFHPGDSITRGEAAEMLYHALEYVAAHPAPAGEAGGQ